MEVMTPKQIESLKLEARHMRKTSDLTHCQALEVLARREGFKTWMALQAAANGDTDDRATAEVRS
jgi:hypothetical protein